MMAERSAEMTVTWVIDVASTSPDPTIFATAVPANAPAIFRTAAMATATLGERTRVDTDVAMAFAVSWKPLMKSKTRARTITKTRRVNVSCIFQDDRFNDVCHVFALVRGVLEVLIDLFPLDDKDRVSDLIE